MSSFGFLALVGAVAVQRLVELSRSRTNERRMLVRGGREHAPGQMKWMKLLHAGWLVAMVVEVLLLDRHVSRTVAIGAFSVFICGQVLRHAAMSSLGDRWTVRIMTVPAEPVRTGGVYRWLRHPNYLGVCLEVAALPMVHGAWLTALIASALNALLLVFRIPAEERALSVDENYSEAFAKRAPGGQ